MLHVQNVYLFHIIQRTWLRHPIAVIALRSLSLIYYETTAVPDVCQKIAVYNSEETKYIMFYVIVHDASSLLLSTCLTKENAMTELLAHLSHWLRVSYCDHWMSVVRHLKCVVLHQQLLQTTSPP